MKAFLFVLSCFLVDNSLCIKKNDVKLPPELSNAIIGAAQQCMMGTNVSMQALLQVVQGGYSEDRNFKEFIYCCYKNAGYLRPDGYIDTEKTVKPFRNNPVVVEGIARCGRQPGGSAEESVFNFFKCFQDTVPVRFTL